MLPVFSFVPFELCEQHFRDIAMDWFLTYFNSLLEQLSIPANGCLSGICICAVDCHRLADCGFGALAGQRTGGSLFAKNLVQPIQPP